MRARGVDLQFTRTIGVRAGQACARYVLRFIHAETVPRVAAWEPSQRRRTGLSDAGWRSMTLDLVALLGSRRRVAVDRDEAGVITTVEEDPSLEPPVGLQDCPGAARRLVMLVSPNPAELQSRPTFAPHMPPIDVGLNGDESKHPPRLLRPRVSPGRASRSPRGPRAPSHDPPSSGCRCVGHSRGPYRRRLASEQHSDRPSTRAPHRSGVVALVGRARDHRTSFEDASVRTGASVAPPQRRRGA